jgi:hypothetical protein
MLRNPGLTNNCLGEDKKGYFCYNSASSRFYREVLYGQVAQSVEQRIEFSENQICPRHLSEITIKRFCLKFIRVKSFDTENNLNNRKYQQPNFM